MKENRVRSIAVVGGGVAGWMAAAALVRLIKKSYCRVVVIEDPRDPARARAEGTIPALQRFHNLLGIDESDLVRRTGASFKLGVEFEGWTRSGESFFHTFCELGGAIAQVPFHHHWLRLREYGDETNIGDYSVATVAARLGRFARTSTASGSPLSLYSYAYHLDAARYADYLRSYALSRGAEPIAAKAVSAELRGVDGLIEAIVLEDGRRIEADFFIDCTGFPGFVTENVLQTGVEDWSRWLPCDRTAPGPRTESASIPVHTKIIADDAGWRVFIPLKDRIESELHYSRAFVREDVPGARSVLNGRPRKFWNRNCVSLPGGRVEPLEGTVIHLVQTGILRLIATFPDRSNNPADADEYNRLAGVELERIRDFLILHYCTAGRADSPFWRHCRAIAIPDALEHKIALFRGTGRVNMLDNEHFATHSWVSLFLGHGIVPARHDPLADVVSVDDVRRHVGRMREAIRTAVQTLPAHRDFLERAA